MIFDFGGDTLDLTVIRTRIEASPKDESDTEEKKNPHYEILALQGVLIGGDDLDSALMTHKLYPILVRHQKSMLHTMDEKSIYL